jgi:uncharacterized protein
MIGFLTEQQALEILRKSTLGRIGCTDGKETYIIPITYLYDGKAIIAHSKIGRKIIMMRENPRVCFEVDHIKTFNNWKTVIAWGNYEEIRDEAERSKALNAFARRMMHIKFSETAALPETSPMRWHPEPVEKSIVYKISITKITGRYERENRDEML